ncbi:fimbria/pilus periplasmic chaperone [Pantoea ananatis]|uniref:fimbria/pilus periplasmic chaperone n=1 Tax=Pantoea ananas TaxID=553 RepID=UPI00051D6CDF|nr:fimbria/pilus periplasmic chaperone [Pantoea ananatis]KGL58120.1 hypothetical protein KR94_01545 [Pantoea ananatis]MCW0332719.1 Chaperone protein caf1M [Pantoea ananatis]
MKKSFVGGVMLLFSAAVIAADQPGVHTREFAIHFDKTRVIYHEKSSSEALSLTNEKSYPVLIQAVVQPGHANGPVNFIVTPPVARLEAGQQLNLRILQTRKIVDETREQLAWVCVKSLPPDDERKATGSKHDVGIHLNMLVNVCEKLIYRPDSLKGNLQDAAGALIWYHDAGRLAVKNPTPFYLSISEILVNKKNIGVGAMVPPFGQFILPGKNSARGSVDWKVIADYGGNSASFHSEIKD